MSKFKSRHDIPIYRRHRASGQAVVTLEGRDFYLGPWNSPQSRAEFDRVIHEWLARGRRVGESTGPDGLLMNELISGYLGYCSGALNKLEYDKVALAVRPVRDMYGDTPAAKFGPIAFQAVRQSMIDARLGIATIRARLGAIKRMVAWGVASEMLPGDALYKLQAVSRLQAGRNGVKPAKKVKPAPQEDIDAILPRLNPVVRAMVQLQVLTGARPGEIRRMTTAEIDRSVDPWLYHPTHHKTERFGVDRQIPIGPRAQDILKPFLKDDPSAPLCSPREACRIVWEASYSPARTNQQRASKRKKNPKGHTGETYSKDAYRWAIELACSRARVPVFTSNQIRHTYAAKVRREYGLESAPVLLGHAKASEATGSRTIIDIRRLDGTR